LILSAVRDRDLKVKSFSEAIRIFWEPVMSRHSFERDNVNSSTQKGVFFYEMTIEQSKFLVIVQRNRYAPEFRITVQGPRDSEDRFQLLSPWQRPISISPDGFEERDYWSRIEPLSALPALFASITEVFDQEFPAWLSQRLLALSDPEKRRPDLEWT
jgi:hypothetical protein